jgi:alpha-glucoside PTS system EIICB component
MKKKLFEKMQHFGSAMFVAAALFPIIGIVLALIQILKNPMLVGPLASAKIFQDVIFIFEQGAWTVFGQMPILFALGFPVMMAQKAHARAVVVTFLNLAVFHQMIRAILSVWGGSFGFPDFDNMIPGGGNGLAMVASIKTLDMNIVGGILIGWITTKLHNRFFDTPLPMAISFFQGSALVAFLGFLIAFPLALATVILWPMVQGGIASLQDFFIHAGAFGIWLYAFLERLLIPTGLHHFIYTPFVFGDAVVEGGASAFWTSHINQFAADGSASLRELFPQGGFLMHGSTKVFGLPAAAYAMYVCADPKNRAKIAGLLVPAALTTFMTGITEPIEFTFLFVAPLLFFVHAFLTACLTTLLWLLGVISPGNGVFDFIIGFWAPMFKNHSLQVFTHIGVGSLWMLVYFFVFRFMILKFNYLTPGRGEAEVKLYKKADYKAKKAAQANQSSQAESRVSIYAEQAQIYLQLLGGTENIVSVTNCATRLRVTVKESAAVASREEFQAAGALGLVIKESSYQVILGPTVSNIRAEVDLLLK